MRDVNELDGKRQSFERNILKDLAVIAVLTVVICLLVYSVFVYSGKADRVTPVDAVDNFQSRHKESKIFKGIYMLSQKRHHKGLNRWVQEFQVDGTVFYIVYYGGVPEAVVELHYGDIPENKNGRSW